MLPEVVLCRRIHESNLTQVAGPGSIKSELLRVPEQNPDRRRRRVERQGLASNGN